MEKHGEKNTGTEEPAVREETPLPEVVPQTGENGAEDLPGSDENWDARILCSDESCIGVIGSNGRCRECGKPAGPGFTPPTSDGTPGEDKPEVANEVSEPLESVDEDLVIEDEDWSRRILCSDESCIGVIGSDGCCRECGRPYEPGK